MALYVWLLVAVTLVNQGHGYNLTWPRKYTVSGTKMLLTANLIEDFQIWETSTKSRVDYNGGAVKSIVKHGRTYDIHPEAFLNQSVYTACSVSKLRPGDFTLPRTYNLQFVGKDEIRDKKTVKYEYEHTDTEENIRVKRTLWASYNHTKKYWYPERYEALVYNTNLGYKDTHEIWEFSGFSTKFSEDEVFDLNDYDCEEPSEESSSSSEESEESSSSSEESEESTSTSEESEESSSTSEESEDYSSLSEESEESSSSSGESEDYSSSSEESKETSSSSEEYEYSSSSSEEYEESSSSSEEYEESSSSSEEYEESSSSSEEYEYSSSSSEEYEESSSSSEEDKEDVHVDHLFNTFKNNYGKNYADDKEHAFRKRIFQNNMRLVTTTNNKNLGYKLAVNKFADRTPKEMKKYMGLRRRAAGKTGNVPFPYTHNLTELSKNLPKEYDLRLYGLVSEVKNQDDCSSCWTFATTAAAEGALARVNGGRLISLANQALIDCSWAFGASGCKGGSDNEAYEWMMKYGLPTEAEYGPYKNRNGICNIKNMTKTYPIRGYTDVTPRSVEAMKIALIDHGPLSVSVHSTPAFKLYSSGIFYDIECSEKSLNHEVALVGYGERYGETFWILKNSWGPTWGIGGYMHISAKDNVCGVATEPTYVVF